MKKKMKIKILNNNLFQLIGSGYFTQFLSLLLLPILVRLYEPSDFGKFAMFIAISSGMGSLATLRYELAFFSYKNERVRDAIITLCLVFAFLMPLFFLFIVFLSLTNIAELLVFFKNNLIYLYISSVLLSLQMIFLAWHNSIGNYKKISLSRIMQSLVVSCLPILIYPLQLASKALIYAQILSLLVSLFVLCRGISFNLAGGVRLFWVIKKFYKNSVIGVPHILFDVMGSIALTSAISKNYGDEVLGYFNIAQRFKNIVSTIGSSYGIMFNEKISKVKNNSYFIKINHLKSLIFPMILIYFGFQFLDSFIIKLFGEKWIIAVEMAKILALQFILVSIIAAFGAYFYLKNRQTTAAFMGLAFVVVNFIAVVLPPDIFIATDSLGLSLAINMTILTVPVLFIHIALILLKD